MPSENINTPRRPLILLLSMTKPTLKNHIITCLFGLVTASEAQISKYIYIQINIKVQMLYIASFQHCLYGR